jgi:hypothetical protein
MLHVALIGVGGFEDSPSRAIAATPVAAAVAKPRRVSFE